MIRQISFADLTRIFPGPDFSHAEVSIEYDLKNAGSLYGKALSAPMDSGLLSPFAFIGLEDFAGDETEVMKPSIKLTSGMPVCILGKHDLGRIVGPSKGFPLSPTTGVFLLSTKNLDLPISDSVEVAVFSTIACAAKKSGLNLDFVKTIARCSLGGESYRGFQMDPSQISNMMSGELGKVMTTLPNLVFGNYVYDAIHGEPFIKDGWVLTGSHTKTGLVMAQFKKGCLVNIAEVNPKASFENGFVAALAEIPSLVSVYPSIPLNYFKP